MNGLPQVSYVYRGAQPEGRPGFCDWCGEHLKSLLHLNECGIAPEVCGTNRGYDNHRARGEEQCPSCLAAHAAMERGNWLGRQGR